MEILIIIAIMILIMAVYTKGDKRRKGQRAAVEIKELREKYITLYQLKKEELLSRDFVNDVYYTMPI